MTYADIRAINGGIGDCFVYDARAFVGYAGESVPHPVGFFLDVEYEEFYSLVTGDDPTVWPEDSMVYAILVWDDVIKHIFQSDSPITLNALAGISHWQSDLMLWPLEDQILNSFGFDVWYCDFDYDDYQMLAIFREEGNEFVLIEMFIDLPFT